MARTVVIAQQSRPAQRLTSAGVVVPGAVSAITITAVLSTADKLAVGKTIAFEAEYSPDGGDTWQRIAHATWESYGPAGVVRSKDGAVNPDPTFGFNVVAYRGLQIRVTVDFPQPLDCGAAIDVV